MKRSFARQGYETIPGQATPAHVPIRGKIEFNLAEVSQGLGKIAFLATSWLFGDTFAGTSGADVYREWIFAEPTMEGLSATQMGLVPDDIAQQICTGLQPHQHRIQCKQVGSTILTAVCLFGNPIFTQGFAVNAPELDEAQDREWVVIVNATEKTLETWQAH